MDNIKTSEKTRLSVLEKSPTSHTSFVLNGALNGATLAGIPVILYESLHKVKGVTSGQPLTKLTAFAAITGAAVGAWYGKREANELSTYQGAVNDEIRKLRADVDAQAQGKAQQAR